MSEVVCLHSGLGSNSFKLKELKWLRGPVHESGNEREIDRWIGAASAVAVCYGRRWHQFTGCFMPPTHAWPQAVDSSQKELPQ